MKLRNALLLTSLTPMVVLFAAVRNERSSGSHYGFENIPAPATNDAATGAVFRLVGGKADPAAASLDVLHDGCIPRGPDEPGSNFFFAPGSGGGRILLDLKKSIEVASVASYSWHQATRAAQTYQLFGASGELPKLPEWPVAPGDRWKLIDKIDTSGTRSGQHGVLISQPDGAALGKFRYLLFDLKPNQGKAPFNQTFFSEIDVIDAHGSAVTRLKVPKIILKKFPSKSGKFSYTLDATEAPDLVEWATRELIPVMDEWYPKIIKMLLVPDVSPSTDITFTLRRAENLPQNVRGVPAYASGDSVVFNADFMRREIAGEAVGAGIHEVVHVVQFAGRDQDGQITRGKRLPTWITEGAADYIRWFLFEPEKNGARITRRNFESTSHDSSYRVSANFFDWVIKNYDKDLMRQLNLSIHEGYREELWKTWTGKSLAELGAEWKEAHRKRLGL